MEGSCEHSNEPTRSLKYQVPKQLVASEEGLIRMELVSWLSGLLQFFL
jgi:hypothetical protein